MQVLNHMTVHTTAFDIHFVGHWLGGKTKFSFGLTVNPNANERTGPQMWFDPDESWAGALLTELIICTVMSLRMNFRLMICYSCKPCYTVMRY